MKRNILLTVLLIFLVVMNGVLLFLVLKGPERKNHPPRDFISNQLGLNEQQRAQFDEIDAMHHQKMQNLELRSRDLRGILFTNLGERDLSQKELDSVATLIGTLGAEREKEVFSYFQMISKVCTEEQKLKLEQILSGALRPGRGMGPRPNGPPPPHGK